MARKGPRMIRRWRRPGIVAGAIAAGTLSLWDSYTLVQHWQDIDSLKLATAGLIQGLCLLGVCRIWMQQLRKINRYGKRDMD